VTERQCFSSNLLLYVFIFESVLNMILKHTGSIKAVTAFTIICEDLKRFSMRYVDFEGYVLHCFIVYIFVNMKTAEEQYGGLQGS